MKAALISLDQKWEDKAYNLKRCEELVARASSLGAELVIFPEMTLTGFTMNVQTMAEPADTSDSVREFGDLARAHGVWLVAGVILQAGNQAANTLVAFSPIGEEQVRYVKVHPFSFAGEDKYFQPGCTLAKMRLPELNIGFSICYDLRFPELYSALAKDCDVLVNIANWPQRRVRHWQVLLKARAIENQVYMVGVNRVGVDGNALEYVHSSLAFDPDGEEVSSVFVDDVITIVEIEKSTVTRIRNSFPVRNDRRNDLYMNFLS